MVSSHVSQVRQGVGPPAQLRIVPDRLAELSRNWPASGSKTRLEVPPLASGSYAGSVNLPEKLPCSWLRLRMRRRRRSIRAGAPTLNAIFNPKRKPKLREDDRQELRELREEIRELQAERR